MRASCHLEQITPARRIVSRKPTRLRLPGSLESLRPEEDGVTTTEVGDNIERRHQSGLLLLLLEIIAAKEIRLDDMTRPYFAQIYPGPVVANAGPIDLLQQSLRDRNQVRSEIGRTKQATRGSSGVGRCLWIKAIGADENTDRGSDGLLPTQLLCRSSSIMRDRFCQFLLTFDGAAKGPRGHNSLLWLVRHFKWDARQAAQFVGDALTHDTQQMASSTRRGVFENLCREDLLCLENQRASLPDPPDLPDRHRLQDGVELLFWEVHEIHHIGVRGLTFGDFRRDFCQDLGRRDSYVHGNARGVQNSFLHLASIVEELLRRNVREIKKTFINAVDFLLPKTISQQGEVGENLHNPIGEVLVERIVATEDGHPVLLDDGAATMVRHPSFESQRFGLGADRDEIAVIVGEDHYRSLLQGGMKDAFDGDVKIVAINQRDDGSSHRPCLRCSRNRSMMRWWSRCRLKSATPQTWKPISVVTSTGGVNGLSESRNTEPRAWMKRLTTKRPLTLAIMTSLGAGR